MISGTRQYRANPGHPLNNGLVAWYCATTSPLGPLWLDLCQGIHGTLGGSTKPAWSGVSHTGGVGSLYFAGSSLVSLQDEHRFDFATGGFTWSFWIKTTSNDYYVISKRPGDSDSTIAYNINVIWNNKLYTYISNGVSNSQLISSASINDGTWKHCVSVWVPGVAIFHYINGVLDSSTSTIITNINNLSQKTCIGSKHESSGGYMTGWLNDVRAYSRPLSAAAVSALYLESCTGNINTLSRSRTRRSDFASAMAGSAKPVLFHSHYQNQGMR